MHYFDVMHSQTNTLVLVFYIHDVLDPRKKKKVKTGKVDPRITSIQECKYFPPKTLLKILKKPKKLYKRIQSFSDFNGGVHSERFYKVVLKAVNRPEQYEITLIADVTNSRNKFLQIH